MTAISDLRHFDLNLLPVFQTLMRERSVTRAGAALSLSQPATSAALARLRDSFHDELFLRTGRTLEPTRRAEQLLADLAPALDSIAAALAGAQPFDPATDERTFHIGCAEDMALVCSPVLRSMREHAPNCRFSIHHATWETIPGMLDSGVIGTALGLIRDNLPANAKRRVLRRGGFRVLRAANTPGPVDLDMFCDRPHVLVTTKGEMQDFVDDALEKIGRTRVVVAGLPDFGMLAQIIPLGQLLCTVSDTLTDILTQGDPRIVADEPPFDCPPSVIHIAWRGALDKDPAEMWLRAHITERLVRR